MLQSVLSLCQAKCQTNTSTVQIISVQEVFSASFMWRTFRVTQKETVPITSLSHFVTLVFCPSFLGLERQRQGGVAGDHGWNLIFTLTHT